MKHLKTFENYENLPVAKYQLSEDQVDDLHEQFDRFIEDWEMRNKEQLSAREMQDMFAEDEKQRLVQTISGSLSQASLDVQQQMLAHFNQADVDYGQRIAKALGL